MCVYVCRRYIKSDIIRRSLLRMINDLAALQSAICICIQIKLSELTTHYTYIHMPLCFFFECSLLFGLIVTKMNSKNT